MQPRQVPAGCTSHNIDGGCSAEVAEQPLGPTSDRPPSILLVEDEDTHAYLFETNFRDAGVRNPIHRVRSGGEAIAFMCRTGPFEGRDDGDPSLILLDIRLPDVSGIGVLQALRTDSRHRQIPIAMLTTSDDPAEYRQCYKLGCNAYFEKLAALADFPAFVRQISWLVRIVT